MESKWLAVGEFEAATAVVNGLYPVGGIASIDDREDRITAGMLAIRVAENILIETIAREENVNGFNINR